MTNKQALAFAKHELEYYKKVERDGIRMTRHIEFYEIIVDALERLIPDGEMVMSYEDYVIVKAEPGVIIEHEPGIRDFIDGETVIQSLPRQIISTRKSVRIAPESKYYANVNSLWQEAFPNE